MNLITLRNEIISPNLKIDKMMLVKSSNPNIEHKVVLISRNKLFIGNAKKPEDWFNGPCCEWDNKQTLRSAYNSGGLIFIKYKRDNVMKLMSLFIDEKNNKIVPEE